ncbi:MAG: 16S rRNA (guanine(527)-N(7))-methyltransferase RsmG [Candidatus Edwardsbacteria bacterium]|nr:16S rRNA (guanine(527)-N(7))-methyltransferase RsmG [Candidatus Edwardsbacteria bacterium]
MIINDLESQKIGQAVQALGVTLSQEQMEKLFQFQALVRQWNAKVNLISRRDIDNLFANHLLDSLTALPALAAKASAEVMDLGPGGGFPGIPLKICLPEIKLTCLEATQKKARFLELAVTELGLPEVVVIAQHSQAVQKDKNLLNRYDFVTARAVAELKELVKISFPFLRVGGKLLAYKSSKAGQEIEAAGEIIHRLGGTLEGELRQEPGAGDKDRKIVIIRKE